MSEYTPQWTVPAKTSETRIDATAKTDKSPSVSFVSASSSRLERISADERAGCEKGEKGGKSPAASLRAHDPPQWAPHPLLPGIRVYRGPIEASVPPEQWDGIAPTGCGAPKACQNLGPCPHFARHGHCWAVKEVPA